MIGGGRVNELDDLRRIFFNMSSVMILILDFDSRSFKASQVDTCRTSLLMKKSGELL